MTGCPDYKGSCQVEKKSKIREKLGLTIPHPPTPYPFFGETCTVEKKHTKNTQIPQKIESELGLDPPTHFRVFLGFFGFFNLTKPLTKPVKTPKQC